VGSRTSTLNNFDTLPIIKPVMANPGPALQCGPSTVSKIAILEQNQFDLRKKSKLLALKMTIFQKCGPRADLGWPWLY
jgi:hypothetical protein